MSEPTTLRRIEKKIDLLIRCNPEADSVTRERAEDGMDRATLDEVIATLEQAQGDQDTLFERAKKLAVENAFLREIAQAPKLDDDPVDIKAWVDRQQKTILEHRLGMRALNWLVRWHHLEWHVQTIDPEFVDGMEELHGEAAAIVEEYTSDE